MHSVIRVWKRKNNQSSWKMCFPKSFKKGISTIARQIFTKARTVSLLQYLTDWQNLQKVLCECYRHFVSNEADTNLRKGDRKKIIKKNNNNLKMKRCMFFQVVISFRDHLPWCPSTTLHTGFIQYFHSSRLTLLKIGSVPHSTTCNLDLNLAC